jgi:hypothetical protein
VLECGNLLARLGLIDIRAGKLVRVLRASGHSGRKASVVSSLARRAVFRLNHYAKRSIDALRDASLAISTG